MEPLLTSSIISAAASSGGSLLSGYLNRRENERAFERQKELQSNQYEAYVKAAKAAGASPAAIISGLTGKGPQSAPAVSTGGNPQPDIDPAAGLQASAALHEANASAVRQNSEAEINQMKLLFEPQKYFADINKSFAEAFKMRWSGKLDKAMIDVQNQTANAIKQKLPWELSQLQQGLLNQIQEFKEIQSRTDYYKSTAALNREKVNTEKTMQGYYNSATDVNYQESYNKAMEGFALQFENFLRSEGYNPNKDPWDNLRRWLYTDPKKFELTIDSMIEGVHLVDNALKRELGDRYKQRGIALYGTYRGLKDLKDITIRALPSIIGASSGNPGLLYPANSSFSYSF